MTKVIKKGGKREKFNLEKIKKSLMSAIERTELPKKERDELIEKITKKVLEFVRGKEEIFTAEIEAKIILELEENCPEAVKLWREYRLEKEKVKKS
jgi:transcriptional regulator NrdR family protein